MKTVSRSPTSTPSSKVVEQLEDVDLALIKILLIPRQPVRWSIGLCAPKVRMGRGQGLQDNSPVMVLRQLFRRVAFLQRSSATVGGAHAVHCAVSNADTIHSNTPTTELSILRWHTFHGSVQTEYNIITSIVDFKIYGVNFRPQSAIAFRYPV